MDNELRQKIRDIFTDEILLSFWTHEKCPPSTNNDNAKCALDNPDVKHDRCLPCWEAWIEDIFVRPLSALLDQKILTLECEKKQLQLCVDDLKRQLSDMNQEMNERDAAWLKLIKGNGLVRPDTNSLTQFEPFYQVGEKQLKASIKALRGD